MKKALTAAGVIAPGAFVVIGILFYKVGEKMTYLHRCGCHQRDY